MEESRVSGPDIERMINALLDPDTRAFCRSLELRYPPLEPELEDQWEAEARNELTDPHRDTPEVLAWILGCIQCK